MKSIQYRRYGFCLLLVIIVMSDTNSPAETSRTSVVRENTEWLDVWLPSTNAHDRPRVLLIGDSITRAYGPEVETRLSGRAYVARLATSKSIGDPALLAEVTLVLAQGEFDVIQFNNGLHGWGYTEAQYRDHFPELIATIRKGAPRAKLIWATITPLRKRGALDQWDPKTDRVRARNAIAAQVVEKEGITVTNLYSVVESKPEFYAADGTHFVAAGVSAQADCVAKTLTALLAQLNPQHRSP